MMTYLNCQSFDPIILEGNITSLSLEPQESCVGIQITQLKVLDKKYGTITISASYSNKYGNINNLIIHVENLQVFAQSIQKNFNHSNSVSISLKNRRIMNILIHSKPKSSVKSHLKHRQTIINSTHNTKPYFSIQVHCNDRLTSRYQEYFNKAAARWSEIIVGSSSKTKTSKKVTKDIVIEACTSNIDGPGKVLGGVGPIKVNAGLILPKTGWILLDSKDIYHMEKEEILVDAILHEIGHALGLGTLWKKLKLVQYIGVNNPVFTGRYAMHEYASLIGSNSPIPVPIENTGHQGVRDLHWRESVFGDELMTSYIGSSNPISRLTIAALKDIGYQVNFSAADNFNIKKNSLCVS